MIQTINNPAATVELVGPNPVPSLEARAGRLASFDPVIRAAVLAAAPLSSERKIRLASIFVGVAR